MKKRLVALLLALVALGGTPALAGADDGSPGGNSAVAINQKDNSDLFKLAFAIRHVMSDTVTEENSAVAYASCNSCETTAIAIEIVLVEGNPTNESPQNAAVAVNESCNLCDTFATAYQFVVNTGGPVRFTSEGIRALHEIRKEIESWGRQHLSNEEIRARLPDVIARIQKILATELVPVGRGRPHEPDENDTTTVQEPTTSTPAPTTTSTPTTETGSVTTTETVPTDTTGTGTDTTQTTTTPTTTTTP